MTVKSALGAGVLIGQLVMVAADVLPEVIVRAIKGGRLRWL